MLGDTTSTQTQHMLGIALPMAGRALLREAYMIFPQIEEKAYCQHLQCLWAAVWPLLLPEQEAKGPLPPEC